MTSFVTSFDTPRTKWGPGSRSLASPTTAFDSVNSAPAEALLKIVSPLLNPPLTELFLDGASTRTAAVQPPPQLLDTECGSWARTVSK